MIVSLSIVIYQSFYLWMRRGPEACGLKSKQSTNFKKCEGGGGIGGSPGERAEGKGNWEEDSRGGAEVAVIGNGKSGDLTQSTYLLK